MSLSMTRAKKALSDTMSMSGLRLEGNNHKIGQLLSLHGHLGLALKEIETLKKQVETPTTIDIDDLQASCDAYEQGFGKGYNLTPDLTNPHLENTPEHGAWYYGCTRGQAKRKQIIDEAG